MKPVHSFSNRPPPPARRTLATEDYVEGVLAGDRAILQQIYNNLRSVQLARAAGYRMPGWNQSNPAAIWLATWKSVVGAKRIRAILRQQGVADQEPYRAIIRGQ